MRETDIEEDKRKDNYINDNAQIMFNMNHVDDKPVLALAKQKTTHKYNASTINQAQYR